MTLDHDQVGHIARMAVLAMCARGVAAGEFDGNPEVQAVAVVVRRSAIPVESLPVDMEFIGASGVVLGGGDAMSFLRTVIRGYGWRLGAIAAVATVSLLSGLLK